MAISVSLSWILYTWRHLESKIIPMNKFYDVEALQTRERYNLDGYPVWFQHCSVNMTNRMFKPQTVTSPARLVGRAGKTFSVLI